MKNAILLKYGELALRGKNRYLFENRLLAQVRKFINEQTEKQSCRTDLLVTKEYGRFLIEAAPEHEARAGMEKLIAALVPGLKMIIGLVGVCPCVKTDDADIVSLRETALRYMKMCHGGKDLSFKVETKRVNKNYPVPSQEVSAEVGGYLLNNMSNLRVDVNDPDVILYIEIRSSTYIYTDSEKGIGGLPVGSSGKGLLLLSGGIDSPAAGFLSAKRGVELEAVYFHSPPYTSERAKLKVVDLVERLSVFAGQIKLHVVPFTDLQLYLRDNVPEDKLTVFLKRAMLNISQEIALANKCRVLINGDSIGQVASQNLASMTAIGSAASLPLIRPLACFDKQEIVDLAKRIGTYDISIRPYDDCCTLFVAKHPELSPKQSVVEAIERNLTDRQKLIDEAIGKTEIIIP